MIRMLVAVVLMSVPVTLSAQQFDILIRGTRLMDGSGNPWRYGDVGINGDHIIAVGNLEGASGLREIDGTGKVVAPGFIDLHSHADDPNFGPRGLRSEDANRRAAPNLVMQGITTVVVNGDGRSPWPISGQRAEWEENGIGPNGIMMVGHGTVRRLVMGDDYQRVATAEEVQRMRVLVRQGMEEGAMGMTAGLEYVPGRWSETDEVVSLVEEIVPFNGSYVAHERSEGADPMWYWPSQFEGRPPSLIDAVRETIEIGERTGARVVASHLKAKGADYWGASSAVIRLIDEARARGVQMYADQYPYSTTGSDGSTVLVPRWALGQMRRGADNDFRVELRRVLTNDSLTGLLLGDIAHEIARRGGADKIVVFEYPDEDFVGKNIEELAAERNVSPVDMAIALQLEGFADRPGGAHLRGFSLSEYDIEPYASQPWMATATDGWVTLPEDGFTHTRVYGSFPRKIAHYARDRGLLTVESAVRSSTSLPAEVMGLADRGWIRQGYVADIVVFDLEELADNATFFDPHQYPSGIEYVLVNGEFVVDGGQPTFLLPGRPVTRPAFIP